MNNQSHEIKNRKIEHIFISITRNVEDDDTFLDDVILIHQSLPELDFNDVSTETSFLGKKLSAPVIISAMTGGHPFSGEINALLAEIAEEKKIGLGVGSQRAGIVDPELSWTYRVVRDNAPSIPIIGNLGAQQLLHDDYLEIVQRAIEMIEADALAIHLNPAQEVFQPEGDPHYRNVINRLKLLSEKIDVPIIVKETGNGISMETAMLLKSAGIRMIDVAGKGGTNWIRVERYRALRNNDRVRAMASKTFLRWGIPTAISVLEVRTVFPEAIIICSGGIRTGLDVAKCLSLGADYTGIALPFLKSAIKGRKSIEEYTDRLFYELKAALFLTGSRNISELKSKKPVLGQRIINWINQRNLKYKRDEK